jgi:hypothetical protein
MDLEIMYSELSQPHKGKHHWFSLICRSMGKAEQNKNHSHECKQGTIREVKGKGKRRKRKYKIG